MADPLKDASLEETQKQIQRRLLREEKLKRVEQEEMRRLAAMGWKPPVERSIAAGGHSIHGAADAIEVTERKRREFAREARRRAEAQQYDPIAMRDDWEIRRRAEDQKGQQQYLDKVQATLERVRRNADARGLSNSARMLGHFLQGAGGVIQVDPNELRRFDVTNDATARLHQHFVDWITEPKVRRQTVIVDSLPRTMSVTSPRERIPDDLLALGDGETIHRNSFWTSNFVYPGKYEMGAGVYLGRDAPNADLLGFAGRAQLRGDGDFRFRRQGDMIEFEGLVDHKFDEPYDFESGTSFPTLEKYDPWEEFSGDDARQLALHGRAKDFRMKSGWPQRVKGALRKTPDGRFELVDDPVWIEPDPYDRWHR